ncbi:MAG TPA: hypothetical protein DCP03_19240 [Polaromonas sp.]|nr:hypothetical protein [Polaromonas sp.]
MGNSITQDMRALWLRLRTDGGWWTLDMLMHHWKPNCAPYEVQHAMDTLEAGGFVESRDHATNLSYGVTLDCKALPGFDPSVSTRRHSMNTLRTRQK